MSGGDRTFAAFMEEVQGSLEEHAERKGYNTNGADGDNALYQFTLEIGAEPGHSVGECIYKLREILHEPREVLALKIAAWMFLLWRDIPTLREMRDLPPEYPNKRAEAVAAMSRQCNCDDYGHPDPACPFGHEAEQVSRCVR